MIPNIIHFIFFGFTKFELFHFLSIVSAYHVQKPDKIYLYNDIEPKYNFFWECIKKYVTIVKDKSPSEFRGIKLNSYQYKADISRMEKLIEFGGIYMDIDILTIRPFTHLLDANCVLGAESSKDMYSTDINKIGSITNAVILCEKDNEFIKFWYNNIADNIINKPWAYHAVCLPKKLLIENTNYNVKLEPRCSFIPFCFRDPYIFNSKENYREKELEKSYTIHLWETIWFHNYLSKINIEYFIKEKNIFVKLFDKYINILYQNIDKLIKIIKECDQNENNNLLIENCKIYIDLCNYFNIVPDEDIQHSYLNKYCKLNNRI